MNLPVILGFVVVSMVTGGLVTVTGYYTPFMILSSVVMAIGSGLLSTFEVDTSSAKWIGYQLIFGVGAGFGMQQTLIVIQSALPADDVPIGTALIMFSQTLGGALFISVGQNIFTGQLIKSLAAIPEVDSALILSAGVTELRKIVSTELLGNVLVAYNEALVRTFYVAVATTALSIAGSGVIEWKSMKGKQIQMAAA